MFKKLSLFAASLAIVAISVPAMASASTGLTMPKGTLVPVGTLITGTSTNSKVTNTKFGTLTCGKITLEGKVTVNSATAGVKAEKTEKEGFGTTCTVGGNTATVEKIKLVSIESPASTPGKGTASFSFVAVLPGSLTCTFTGTNVPGTYVSETDELAITNAPLTVSPASCVSKTPELTGTFTLETPSTAEPVFLM